jgi:NAD(P)-dependent dehydrogenase (short-subunit alcohol dehydrogenase family)
MRVVVAPLLALVAATASAFTPTIRSSRISHALQATKQNDETSIDRRNFFISSAAKAVSISALVATNIDVANAVTPSTSYSSLYQPDPHSMDGKIVVITGGNTGLGLESTKRLAKAGATVVFTSRDQVRGNKALDEVNQYLKDSNTDDSFVGKAMVVTLDLCDLDNVKSFKSRLEAAIGKDTKVDVLLNNAGVMAIPDRRITKDNFEQTFQTNHLGHFALTSSLLPMLSKDARVINVSSVAYQFAAKGLDLDNLNGEKEYGPWSSYGASKLENIFFTSELQRRASESESYKNLKAFSLHPGAVQTDLAKYLIGEDKFATMKEKGFSSWKDKLLFEGLAKFVKTVQEGASCQVFLAAADIGQLDKDAGKFFNDGKAEKLPAFATDADQAKNLWTKSEEMANVKFEL